MIGLGTCPASPGERNEIAGELERFRFADALLEAAGLRGCLADV